MAGYFKGSTVVITATFKTPTGDAVVPDTITVSFSYNTNKVAVTSPPFAMSLVDGRYIYHWDSSPADPGRFYWTVTGVSGPDSSKAGGSDLLFAR